MEAEAALNLFEQLWFHLQILEKRQPNTSTSSTPNPSPPHQQTLTIEIPIPSPDPALKPHLHLQTIPSDREIVSSETVRQNKRKKRLSKSLSELEFEEVKGFINLGFVFSEEDVHDSDLVKIIPGLQKLGLKSDGEDVEEGCGVRARPYLSEAWEMREEEEEEEEERAMRWRVAAARNEMEMKDSLKSWAHTVASAVR